MKAEQFKHNSVEAYEKAYNDAEQKKHDFDKARSIAYDEMEEATKELKAEMKRVEAPFLKRIEKADKSSDKASDERYSLDREKRDFISYLEVQKASESGEMNVESFKAFLSLHNLECSSYGGEIDLKKDLPNGVKIFRQYDEGSFRKYFCMKGMKLVGYWCKRIAEHPGDETSSDAWMGVKRIHKDNTIKELAYQKLHPNYNRLGYEKRNELREKHPFYRASPKGWGGRTDLTANQFFKYVGEQKKFVEIEHTHKDTHQILANRPW